MPQGQVLRPCNDEAERLKARLADISYRYELEKAGRIHIEAMYDKAVQNETHAVGKYHALDTEVHSLQKVCTEAVAIRKALEGRLKDYSHIKRQLEHQLEMERHSRHLFEDHIAHFMDALQLMGRLLQVQSQRGVEDLPNLVIERALLQRDVQRLRSGASTERTTDTVGSPSKKERPTVSESE